jgi:hypothetical protein
MEKVPVRMLLPDENQTQSVQAVDNALSGG